MAKQERKVAVADLPYYKSEEESVFVDDPPLLLQPFAARQWEFFRPGFESLSYGYASSSKFCAAIRDFVLEVPEWFTDEKKVIITKAVAITVGGMGGYLLGMRKGGLVRRTVYSGVGMAFLAAFCYPHQTMDICRGTSGDTIRDIGDNLKQRWNRTFASYPFIPLVPPNDPKLASKDTNAKSQGSNKDKDSARPSGSK